MYIEEYSIRIFKYGHGMVEFKNFSSWAFLKISFINSMAIEIGFMKLDHGCILILWKLLWQIFKNWARMLSVWNQSLKTSLLISFIKMLIYYGQVFVENMLDLVE